MGKRILAAIRKLPETFEVCNGCVTIRDSVDGGVRDAIVEDGRANKRSVIGMIIGDENIKFPGHRIDWVDGGEKKESKKSE
jgi:hypothetical protein